MIYKRSLLSKIFNTKRHCCYQKCDHIFKDGEELIIYDGLFGDETFCRPCFIKFCNDCERTDMINAERVITEKRADYKILAEEIVKILRN